MTAYLPLIGITMGDPAGVGPEIIAKAISSKRTHKICRPLVVGEADILRQGVKIADVDLKIREISSLDEALYQSGVMNVLAIKDIQSGKVLEGKVSALAGDMAFQSVKNVIDLALQGQLNATVTAPIHKESLNKAGHKFSGHTEIYAHFTGTKRYAMLLVHGNFRVIHVSTHVSLREACDQVKTERILDIIALLHDACKQLGVKDPKIGVAGLNPHAGDGGLFGYEEENEILPAVKQARSEGYHVEGPIPADTLFSKARGGKYDGCVAMYHDQGHIPFKFEGFIWDKQSGGMKTVSGVNITLGLPIIRTSVDHGTAFDIAGKGIASPNAMILAIDYAVQMSNLNNIKI